MRFLRLFYRFSGKYNIALFPFQTLGLRTAQHRPSGRVSGSPVSWASMHAPKLNEPLPVTTPHPAWEIKNGISLPANIDAASGYCKVILPGELENKVQTDRRYIYGLMSKANVHLLGICLTSPSRLPCFFRSPKNNTKEPFRRKGLQIKLLNASSSISQSISEPGSKQQLWLLFTASVKD